MLCNLKEIVKRNTVLKGIDPILTPELLMHLSAMGHG
ncbi:MAG: hypothetical protein RLY90_266, partial [Pseudomonadota bacterium]